MECLSIVQSCKCLGMELQVVATAGAHHTLIVNRNRSCTSLPEQIIYPTSTITYLHSLKAI
jgi:hypothetical protein